MKKSKAQSMLEYSVILGLAFSVLMAMQVYLRRGIQAGVRVSADQLGKQEEGLPYYDPALGGPTTGLEEEDMPEGGFQKSSKTEETIIPGGVKTKTFTSEKQDIPIEINLDGQPQTIDYELTRWGGFGSGKYYDPRDWSLHDIYE